MHMMRLREVLKATGYKSAGSIRSQVAAGVFPERVKIGSRAVAWPSTEVSAVLIARVGGMSEEFVRALVSDMAKKRTAFLSGG